MVVQPVTRIFSEALALTSLLLATTSRRAQTPKALPGPLQRELVHVRAENAAIREELRKLEERHKLLLQLVTTLQRQCDESPAPVADGTTNHAKSARVL